MIGSEQRFVQSVRIFVGKFLAVEVGIGGVDDTMVVGQRTTMFSLTSGPPRERYWMWWVSEKAMP